MTRYSTEEISEFLPWYFRSKQGRKATKPILHWTFQKEEHAVTWSAGFSRLKFILTFSFLSVFRTYSYVCARPLSYTLYLENRNNIQYVSKVFFSTSSIRLQENMLKPSTIWSIMQMIIFNEYRERNTVFKKIVQWR
jgi:hypothetical protein